MWKVVFILKLKVKSKILCCRIRVNNICNCTSNLFQWWTVMIKCWIMHHREINQTLHLFKSKRKCLFLFWQLHVHLFFRNPSVLNLFGFSDNIFQYKKILGSNIIQKNCCNYMHMCLFSCRIAIWYTVNCIKKYNRDRKYSTCFRILPANSETFRKIWELLPPFPYDIHWQNLRWYIYVAGNCLYI